MTHHNLLVATVITEKYCRLVRLYGLFPVWRYEDMFKQILVLWYEIWFRYHEDIYRICGGCGVFSYPSITKIYQNTIKIILIPIYDSNPDDQNLRFLFSPMKYKLYVPLPLS